MAARRPHTTLSPAQPAATFTGLGVPAALAAVLAERGIDTPFPIQTATLPDSLAGRDVLGRGRTGSGKTYAFLLPMLARLAASNTPRRPGRPRALILAPTRELVGQITESLAPLAKALKLRTMTVFGGVAPRPQINGLRAGVDILVACPGRLADHMGEGHANLDAVEITVLDEADHMADLGFLPVVRRLLDTTPKGGQRLLFSATLDSGVDTLVRRYLSNPVTHSVDSAQSPVTAMTHHVLQVRAEHRLPVLADLTAAPGRTVVFTRTKRGATKLTKQLIASGVPAVELHGNLGQSARTRNLGAFAEGRIRTLVATDIAARGIHVDDVTLVVHADPPMEHKAYLHRSGRTARAGAAGTVVTLMTADQAADVRDLTRKAGISPQLTKVTPEHPLLAQLAVGERCYVTPPPTPAPSERQPARRAAAGGGRGAAGGRRGSGGRASATPRNGSAPDEGSGTREGSGQRGGSGQRTGSGRGGSGQRTGSGQRGGPRPAKDADAGTGTRRGGSGARRAPASPAAAATPAGSAASFSAKSRAGARRGGR
ncbi:MULTISPECIES: DEAD/DEAH box helicase [unclassified Crossiella]|uniref:DEAD/DEAH box helicase n=1 Tax=unclassified Crossiella TaxID=2620835 RepID=UPI001FFE31B4|nr:MULTISPECIES: DEAD/DEAH box helicase [unclassified Crossiella]MCK2238058.1 DEAD/DEAH box helicase [Crossiella sp. S99.2]MCK2256126.1 DEAD/DEAH box helicase [Crossiella sp. S99.1]